MTLAELRTLERALVRDPDGTGLTDAEWKEITNASYLDFAEEIPLVETETSLTLPAGATEVAFSAPVILSTPPAIYHNGFPLRRVARRDLPPPRFGTIPRFFALLDSKAIFDIEATANVPLKLVAGRRPAPLVADTDVPALPEEFHRGIAYMAVARVFFAARNAVEGTYWAGEAEKIKRRARRAYNERHRARRGREDIDAELG